MAYVDYWGMLGYTNNAWMFMEAFNSPSAIVLTGNPEYTLCDFQTIFPVFQIGDGMGMIPEPVFNLFLAMANKSIKYDRFHTSWKYLMSLYIAHYLTLYLQTQSGEPGAQSALQSALPTGVATSKSVGDLSISYDLLGMADDFKGYGTWKLTKYGQQLITMTKSFGHTGMWVNG